MGVVFDRAPFSYRDDPTVPSFDDGGPVAFLDGDCVLCSAGARLIARFDRKREFKLCRVQSPTGRAVFRHFGLDPDDPDSWLYLVDGRAYTSLDAIIRIGARVGGVGWLLQVFRMTPRPAQDWLYRRVARNRYRLFGRGDICAIPDVELRKRLLE